MTRSVWALLALAGMGCRPPTEITVHISTNASCTDVAAGGTAIFRGAAGSGDQKAASTTDCAGGTVGTFVFYPSGDKTDRVSVKVVTGLGKSPDQCTEAEPAGCIFARRTLRYVPHSPLDLPIAMNTECEGIVCDPTTTCIFGVCKAADVNAPGFCDESCSDGGVTDASRPDGALFDATAPDGGAPDATLDGPSGPCVEQLLAPGATMNVGLNLAVNADQVFWAQGNSISYVPKTGGAIVAFDTTTAAPGLPNGLAADQTQMYYGISGAAGYVAPITGASGGGTQVVASAITQVATDGAHGYFTAGLASWVVTGTAASKLDFVGAAAIATDGARVFWGDGLGPYSIGYAQAPLSGTTVPLTLASNRTSRAELIAVSAPGAYWVEFPAAATSSIFYAEPTNGVLSVRTESSVVDALAADEQNVYWLYEPLAIAKAPKIDPTQKTVLPVTPAYGAMAIDKDCVYFMASDGLRKAPK